MPTQPEYRKSARIAHESIIKIEDDLSLYPRFGVSHNVCEMGMYFESLFEFCLGGRILIRFDVSANVKAPVLAKVVRCSKLENPMLFRYGIGAKFKKLVLGFNTKTSASIPYRVNAEGDNAHDIVTELEKRLPEHRRQPSPKYSLYAKMG